MEKNISIIFRGCRCRPGLLKLPKADRHGASADGETRRVTVMMLPSNGQSGHPFK